MTFSVQGEEERRARKRRGFFLVLLWLLGLAAVLDPLLGLIRHGVLDFAGQRFEGREVVGPAAVMVSVPVTLLALGLQQLYRGRR